ncbi:hypothetical protein D9M71_102940 [compost metagenome]
MGADVARAEAAVGVVAEGAGEPGQLQLRFGNLQPRAIGGEVDYHPRLPDLALGQRDVQLQLAFQRALALPAGEGLVLADRRILENLQAIPDAAVDPALDVEMADLARFHMGNIHRHVAHPALQDVAAGGLDPHAAVLDPHLAIGLAQRRPARLVVQLGVVHAEIQAHGVGLGRRIVVQVALPLEIALLDAPALDRRMQPLGQVLVHRRQGAGQVLVGEARIAVAEADPQVHVVFPRRIAHQADQHVAGQPSLVALDPHQVAAEGQGLLVQRPEQPRVGAAIAPGLGEQPRQVQQKVLRRRIQPAAAEVAAEGAADVLHRRHLVEGADADPLQVGRIGDPPGALALRPEVQVDVVQHAVRLQPLQPGHRRIRQRRQRLHGGGQRRQVEAVGAQLPALLALALVQQFHFHFAPAGIAEVGGEVRHAQAQVIAIALEEQAHAEIAHRHRLALVVAGHQPRRVQAGRAGAGLAILDIQPDFAAGLQLGQAPAAGQAGRQPFRPVALRQAEIGAQGAAPPVVVVQPAIDAQRQRLAVRQVHPPVQALASAGAVAQGQAQVVEHQRLAVVGQQDDLAAGQRQARGQRERFQQLPRIAAGTPRRQAFRLPLAIRVLAQRQVQSVQFQPVDAQLAGQQAVEHMRRQPRLFQAHRLVALAELDVARHHHRRETAPVPFQRADPHRQAGPLAGFAGHFLAVFADQRRQLAPEADVQREQHQPQRAQRQQQAQRRGQQAGEAFHLSGTP